MQYVKFIYKTEFNTLSCQPGSDGLSSSLDEVSHVSGDMCWQKLPLKGLSWRASCNIHLQQEEKFWAFTEAWIFLDYLGFQEE